MISLYLISILFQKYILLKRYPAEFEYLVCTTMRIRTPTTFVSPKLCRLETMRIISMTPQYDENSFTV